MKKFVFALSIVLGILFSAAASADMERVSEPEKQAKVPNDR